MDDYQKTKTYAIHNQLSRIISVVPDKMWSTGPFDVGLVEIPLVRISLKPHTAPVYRRQFPLRHDQVAGIANIIESLIKSGVLISSDSPWNMPINPVPKQGKPDYRMVHDLRPINNVVVPTNYDTPNPHTLLNALSPNQRLFSCTDLSADVFFLLSAEKADVFLSSPRFYRFTSSFQSCSETVAVFIFATLCHPPSICG